MTRTLPTLALALAFGSFLPASIQAQDKPDTPAKDPKIAIYESALKDLKRIDGPMPMYQRGKDVLIEIPEDKIGKLFFIQAALSTGIDGGLMSAGMPIGDTPVDAFKWVRSDNKMLLMRPNIQNRWSADDPLAIGAVRTFPEATLSSVPIIAENPEKKVVLVNATSIFYGELFHLTENVQGTLNGPYQPESVLVEGVHGFPENSVVQMKIQYASPRGSQPNPLLAALGLVTPNTLEDDRSAPLRVSYDMWYRKDNGYVPRVADPRIGYFTQDYFSLDRYLDQDRTERFINRWNLIKRDPKAALSEPVKPIVWTIDPSIPAEYRPAVKEGILRWNKAFEALGFKNAVQVQDVPADDKNYDHADGRYNVVRMLVGPGAPFAAISLPRTDPISGEILNASITLDANLIRDLQVEHQHNQASMASGMERMNQVLLRDPSRKVSDDFLLFATPEQRAQQALQQGMKGYSWASHACDYAEGLENDMSLSYYAILAAGMGPINKEEYVKRYIADCVSHEMGHCLGLRHNFAGSTNLSTAQLADDSLTTRVGLSASVMDYTPPNVQAVLKGRGNYYQSTVGEYDLWAIKYGYSELGGKTPQADKYALGRIARESSMPGHAYKSDEDVNNLDPYAVKFDLGSDPLNFSEKVLYSMDRARSYAIQNLPMPGESYSKRTSVIVGTLARSFGEGRICARFVGGVVANKNFKGDAGEKPTLAPVTPAVQRQAVSIVVRHFFAPNSFAMPSAVLSNLSVDENDPAWTAPLRDIIGGNQQKLLALLISGSATDRIAENAYKQNGYSLVDHYGAIMGAIFSEVGQNQKIVPLRRDLQRFALNGLMTQAGAPQGGISEDVRMITSDMLRRLDKRFVAQMDNSSKLDEMTRIHLRDCHATISRFLNRTQVETR